jgi:hypothetical protein
MHLSELLRAAMDGDDGEPYPEQRWAPRPAEPSDVATSSATVMVAGLLAAAGYGAARKALRT